MCGVLVRSSGHYPIHALFLLALLLCSAESVRPARAQSIPECRYAVTDLGTLGGPGANALGINQNGQVVGAADTADGSWHAYLWAGGFMTDLGTLGSGRISEAWDINDQGQFAGYSELRPWYLDWHAVLWQEGQVIDLGTLGGPESVALAINNRGEIVGYSNPPESSFDNRPFLWENGVMYDLGSFDGPGTGKGIAWDINDSSQIVGGASRGAAGGGGFLWENGSMQDLGDVDGAGFGPIAINQFTQIAGSTWDGVTWRAYLWDQGTFTYLGPGFAWAINGHAHVMGDLTLWRDGVAYNLNDCLVDGSGWFLLHANDINDAGQIVGYGIHQGFNAHRAFLLDPCPPLPAPANIVWNADPLSADRASRSLKFQVAAAATATCFPPQDAAIKVTMVDLQNPVPPNLPQFPPPNFSTFESATCTAAGETNGCARWVGKPGTFLEAQDLPTGASNRAARLQCTPYYTDWITETTSGPIAVVGAEIAPSSEYSVQAYSASCKGSETGCTNVSAAVTILTRRSGDVERPFHPPSLSTQPNVTDVTQVVNKIKNAAGALTKAITQIQPNVPELNADVSALDIVAVVDAVKQFAYAFSGPCPCPSTVTCGPAVGSVACAAPAVCVTAFGAGAQCVKTCSGGDNAGDPCINNLHCPGVGGACGAGFCRDRCGRCTP